MGVLAYVLFYLHTRSINLFESTTKEQLKAAKDQQTELVLAFKSEQKAERDMCERNFQFLANEIKDIQRPKM
jgi:hypothetical protein